MEPVAVSGMFQQTFWEDFGSAEIVVTLSCTWWSRERFWILTGVCDWFFETSGKLVLSLLIKVVSSWVNFTCGRSVTPVLAKPEKEKKRKHH